MKKKTANYFEFNLNTSKPFLQDITDQQMAFCMDSEYNYTTYADRNLTFVTLSTDLTIPLYSQMAINGLIPYMLANLLRTFARDESYDVNK